MNFSHKPVLLEETIDALNIKPDGIYVDGTAGGGGHSSEILKRLSPNGKLISIDQDPDAIQTVTERFKDYQNSIICKGNFSDVVSIVKSLGIEKIDGIMLDIGVSSRQLDTPERGFSFHYDAPLDMRMSQSGTSAYDLVNQLPYEQLVKIISRYGEEKFAKQITRAIIREREKQPIATTLQLAEIIKAAVPAAKRREGHPARQTFQALRIAVNGELDRLEEGLQGGFELLKPGGRMAVITFHSLEDRIVKKAMAKWCTGCTCPKDFPVCVCGNKPKAELALRKPVEASEKELSENPRARSARLRAVTKL
ncbi:16S rRNA (cytosine(1402)-N(4))-methyltransferase RsmH [Oscillospiraceae bacterium LCP25S3_E10]|nr:16S rRNA (cytosine(1402)-N(4))-methyltransferase RsmH [Ruminococcus sp.]MDD6447956.1 16S rRNA (cytosine(1402)-N(4))-methyltransferase RsmH [Ruminococcus sp.]MDY2855501.1 16S rRNA (cytosine(1402)-N(4))-methyltransferase RsmH [Oscillospiraceae bacterium]